MTLANNLGLLLGAAITIAIIAFVIWLSKSGRLMYRSGAFRVTTLKEDKQDEKDILKAKSEVLHEARKAELGNLHEHVKSLAIDGKVPAICPSCKAKSPDWANVEIDNKGFDTSSRKYKYQCSKCNYSHLYENLHA